MNPFGTTVPTPKAVAELYIAPGKMGPSVVVIESPELANPPPLLVSQVKELPLATVPPSSNVPVRDNAIVDVVLMRVEYLYYGFPGRSAAMVCSVAGAACAPPNLTSAYTWNAANIQELRVALSYKF
jgi:hypothetical protein